MGFSIVPTGILLIIINFLFLHDIIILYPIIGALYMISSIIVIYLIISKYKVMSTNYVISMFMISFWFFNSTLAIALFTIKPVNISLLTWFLSNFSFILIYVLSIKIMYMRYKPARIILNRYDGKFNETVYIAVATSAALMSLLSTHAM